MKKNKLEVYHAGTDQIEKPDCAVGRDNLDFGQGFYITDIYDQAINFARVKSRDRKLPGLINVYLLNRFDMLKDARVKIFDSYNKDWLEFIVNCRKGGDLWKSFDYIEGGVADDRVIDTVNLYVQGFISEERALQNLRYLKPNNQICITNQSLLDKHLSFIDCINIQKDDI